MTKNECPTHDIARKNHPCSENDNPVSTAATREPSDRTHTSGHSSGQVEPEPFAIHRVESPFDELPVNSLEIESAFPIGDDIRAATLEILYMVPPHHLHAMYTRLMTYQNTLLALRALRGKA